ncbi:uncharacterized protein LOC135194205 [Vanessa tameamea]|uniref:Uncharacterized protein LOC135194205 n=1 Tax=Vanessa tameamea TaxID=334116 RepID=A0ABM4AVV7_VANTA
MNKTTVILNLIIYLFSVVKAINETNTSKDSDEFSERIVEAVTIQNSYAKDLSNVVNKLDIVSTSKVIGNNNTSKIYYVKIRRLKEPEMGNDKAPKINTRRYSTTTEKSIPVIIDSPEEKSDEKLTNKTETIHEDANELIKNVNISEIENTTEGLQIKDEVKQNVENPLESHFEQEPVTYESVIEEDKTEKPSDELSSDEEALDDIHTRRMMNARQWNEDENAHDENDFKKVLVWKNDDDVLLDVIGRSDKDNAEQVAIAKAEMKPKLKVTTPANFNIYGNSMNHPVRIQHPQHDPSVIQSKCLENPALFNLRSPKPDDKE